jgi:hypothetical protein
MNMMRTATEWLNAQRNSYLSEKAIYIHFGSDAKTLNITVTRGRTIFKTETDYGITVRIRSIDFLVSAEQIPFVPQKGDEIHCDGYRYEILAPNNEPVWRWSDPSYQIMRIHTKEMGDVNDA